MSCYCLCSVSLRHGVGLQCVILVFPCHTHLLFSRCLMQSVLNQSKYFHRGLASEQVTDIHVIVIFYCHCLFLVLF